MSETMSAQAVFDAVVAHMDKQRQPASVDNGCVYRRADGCKCAIGGLLTNPELDAVEARGLNIDAGVQYVAGTGLLPSRLMPHVALSNMAAYLEGSERALLPRLQSAHDASAPGDGYMAEWVGRMRLVAGDFGLSTAKLDQVAL